jgi:hypothetical protein
LGGGKLLMSTGGYSPSGGGVAFPLDSTGATALTDAMTLDVVGDTGNRFVINQDGTLEWGSGAGLPDASLARKNSAGQTRVDLATNVNLRLMGGALIISNAGGSSNFITLHSGAVQLLDAVDIQPGTGTGTKIGTSAAQKLGFWNTAPIAQPSGTSADAVDLATALALVNNLKAKLIAIGLIA